MANFNLVIDTSNFKPYDLGETLLILRDYRDAYYRTLDELSRLEEEWGDITLPDDSKYKNDLDQYTSDFETLSADFARGMNIQNASQAYGMRTKYRKRIKPIKQAVEAYNKYQDKWDALYASDPTAIQGYHYTVDDFYGGKRPDLGYRSGKLILADAATYFAGIQNALAKDPEFIKVMDGQYYMMKSTPGVSSGDILKAALDNYDIITGGERSAEVNDIKNHIQKLFDLQGAGNMTESALRLILDRISLGFISSIEKPQYNMTLARDYADANTRYATLHSRSSGGGGVLYSTPEYSDLLNSCTDKNVRKELINMYNKNGYIDIETCSTKARTWIKAQVPKAPIGANGSILDATTTTAYYSKGGTKTAANNKELLTVTKKMKVVNPQEKEILRQNTLTEVSADASITKLLKGTTVIGYLVETPTYISREKTNQTITNLLFPERSSEEYGPLAPAGVSGSDADGILNP